MKASNLLNVAGSIGGIARTVGNLANLFGSPSGTWQGSLKTAMYGGVPFGVESVRTGAGRRTAIHTYPFRDEVWVEDLGKKPRQFEVLGFLVEDDVITKAGGVVSQRDALLKVCETAGPQDLVHPTLGTIKNVCCLSVETVERRDLGRVFEIRLTLIVSGKRLFPTDATSTQDAVGANAQLTGLAALLDFASKTVSAIQAGAAAIQAAVSTVVGWYQFAVGLANGVRSIIGAVSNLFGNFGNLFGGGNNGISGSNTKAQGGATAHSLLAAATAARARVTTAGNALVVAAGDPGDTATLGAAIQSLLTAVVGTTNDPREQVQMLMGMATYSSPTTTVGGSIGAAMTTMQTAVGALLRRYSLATLATALTTYQPSSQNEASSLMLSVAQIMDDEITIAGDSGDDQSYQALRALRQSVIADLQARGGDLVQIAAFEFQAAMPSLVLANRIYRDPSRADELVRQIKPIHPAFCPRSFQALAE